MFPGSFDPLSVAHVAIADAARRQCDLVAVDLVISHTPLGKQARHQSPVAERLATIERVRSAGRAWLGATTSTRRFLADLAAGYDVLVVGADKWHQLHDLAFYDDATHRDRLLASLPLLAVVPRADVALPDAIDGAVVLDVDDQHRHVSSSAIRAGAADHWRA